MPPSFGQRNSDVVQPTELQASPGALPVAKSLNRRWMVLALSVFVILLMIAGLGYGASLLTAPRTGTGAQSSATVAPAVSSGERSKLADKAAGPTDLDVTSLAAQTADIKTLLVKALQVSGGAIIQGGLTVQGGASVNGTLTATSFSGNGAGVTNVDAALLGGQPRSYYETLASSGSSALTSQVNTLSANAALRNVANTFTAANNFAGNVTVSGASVLGAATISSLVLGSPLSAASGGTGLGSVPAQGVLYGQGGATLATAVPTGAGLCLLSGVTDVQWGSCSAGSTGVSSLNGLTGALAVANASAAGGVITIDDAGTSAKGLASFNAANFTVTAGVVNTVQDIATSASPTFAGLNTNSLTPSGPLTVGAASQSLTLQGSNTTITATNGGNVAQLTFVAPTAAVTYRLQTAAAGTYDVCTTAGNCVGVGGSVSTSGGSVNTIPKYTSASSIGPSLLTDNGSLVTVGGSLTVTSAATISSLNTVGVVQTDASGTLSTGNLNLAGGPVTGQLPLANGGTGAATSAAARSNLGAAAAGANADITSLAGLTTALSVLQGGTGATTLTSHGVLIGNGTSAISSLATATAGQCLVSGGAGVDPSWQACPGSGGAVASLNGQTGAVTIANASASAGTITIQDASTSQKGLASFNAANFTVTAGVVNTVQDIATSASPAFAALNTNTITPSGAMAVGAAARQITLQGNAASVFTATNAGNTTTLGFATPTANTTLNLPALSAGTYTLCTTSGNCSGAGGGVTTAGGVANTLAKFSGAQTLTDSIISDDGATVTVAGGGVIQGSGGLTLGTASGNTGKIVFYNSTNSHATTLQSAGATADYTYTLPVADGSNGQCMVTNGSGGLSFGPCLTGAGGGSGGVTSVNGLSGVLSVANASGSGSTITINDASTSQKGLASFNATNFTASSGAINTVQDIASTAAPAFAGLTLTGSGTALSVTNDAAIDGSLSVNAAGVTTNLNVSGTTSSGALSITNNAGIGGSLNVSGSGGITIGSATQVGQLALRDGSSAFANSLQLTGTLTANRTIHVPAVDGTLAVSASGNIALSAAGDISFTGSLPAASGGTGLSSYTLGDILYATGAASLGRLSDVASGSCLLSGGVSAAPVWGSCTGTGSVSTPGGSTNRIAKFTSSSVLGDSSISDTGTSISIQPSSNGSATFQVLNASAVSLLTVDTSGNRILGGANTSLILSGATASMSNPQGQTRSEAFGSGAAVSNSDAVALGYNAAAGNSATAIGSQSIAQNSLSVAIGSSANAGSQSISIGSSSNTNGAANAIAIGRSSSAGNASIVIGDSAASANTDSIVLGHDAVSTADHQLVIGGSASSLGYITAAYLGSGVTDATPQSVTLQATGGSGTNVAGASLTVQGGTATGTATGGAVNLNGGATASGARGAVNLNVSVNAATNINTGSSTGSTNIGNALSTTNILGVTNINPTGSANTNINTGVNVGSVNIGNTSATTNIVGTTNINTSGSLMTNIGNGVSSGINLTTGAGAAVHVTTNASNSGLITTSAANSTAAFQVQDASTNPALNVNTNYDYVQGANYTIDTSGGYYVNGYWDDANSTNRYLTNGAMFELWGDPNDLHLNAATPGVQGAPTSVTDVLTVNGATGNVAINTVNTGDVSIGNTTGSLTLQGGGSVSLASSNGANHTTLGFSGTQAAGNITYNLDRTAAAGTYTICTSAVSSCGGTTGPYVALQSALPGTQQTGSINVQNVKANYFEASGYTLSNTAGAAAQYINVTAASSTNTQTAQNINLTVAPASPIASYNSYNGNYTAVTSNSANVANADINGIQAATIYSGGSGLTMGGGTGGYFVTQNTAAGTLTGAVGGSGEVDNTGSGTIGVADALWGQITNTGSGTISQAHGLRVLAPINSGGGNITQNFGVYIENQTAAAANYGVYIQGASTAALYVNSGLSSLNGGLSVQGATNINTSGASATNINTGSSTGAVSIGNASNAANTVTINAGSTGGINLQANTSLISDAANAAHAASLAIDSTATSATNMQHGLSVLQTVSPSSTSSTDYANAYLYQASSSTNLTVSNTLYGMQNTVQYATNGTLGGMVGQNNQVMNSSTGTVQGVTIIRAEGNNAAGGVVNNWTGVAIQNPSNAGTITNNRGLWIENQTAGTTSDYGIYIAGADTAALYVNSGLTSLNGGLSVQGATNINTGSSTSATTIGNNSAGAISLATGSSSGINLTTNNAAAGVTVKSATNSTAAFQIQNSAGASSLTVDTSNQQVYTKQLNVGDPTALGGDSGRLFSADFEGSIGINVFGYEPDNEAGFTVDSTTKNSGRYSMKITETGSGTADYTPITNSSTSEIYARAYVNYTSSAQDFDIIGLSDNTKNYFVYRQFSTGYLCIWNDGTHASYCSTQTLAAGAWHRLEFHIIKASSNGTLQLWYDNSLIINRSPASSNGVNTGAANVSVFQIGDDNSSRSSVFNIDDIVVDTVPTGDPTSLSVNDSLHVAGTATISGNTVIEAPASPFAFNVQQSDGDSVLSVDTENDRVTIDGADYNTTTLTQRLCHNGADGQTDQLVLGDCKPSGQSDVAEFYSTRGSVEPGDLVATYSGTTVEATSKPYQDNLIGAVSTNPTADGIMGYSVTSASRQPIALAGRIPVKVSLENGPVHAGDPLTASSTPGVAMKATKPGRVIGTALEDYDAASSRVSSLVAAEEADRAVSHATDLPAYTSDPSKWAAGVGKIMVITNVSYYDTADRVQGVGDEIDQLQARVTAMETAQGGQITGNLNVSGALTATNLTVTGTATIAGLTVTGNAHFAADVSVAGTLTTGAILVNGHIATGGATPALAAQAAAGQAAEATAAGTDTAGLITLKAGSSQLASGALLNLTFAVPYDKAPRVVLTPANSQAAAFNQTYVDAATVSGTAFQLKTNTAPAAGTTYQWYYQVIQ